MRFGRKPAEQEAQDGTDALTGLQSRRFFLRALADTCNRAKNDSRVFALMILDLDDFKSVNDDYGHLEGDIVLQRVSHILEKNCHRPDVVARYGGDEFVILIPDTSVAVARRRVSSLWKTISADPQLRERNITASFGLACYPANGSTTEELLQCADIDMYRSKRERNRTSDPGH